MADIIKSYLVSLSATTDKASFDKFQSSLGGAEKAVASSVGSMAGKMLAFEIAGVTAFASVGFGLLGYIDKLAMSDAAMKRTAQQNMMNIQQYRGLQNTLSALGMTMDDVFRGTPEDRRRFHDMYDHMAKLGNLAGGGKYEDQMVQARRVVDQMSMLEASAQYFGMRFASDVLSKLGFGEGGILVQLGRLNDFVLQNMPQWSNELSTDIIPILKDFWGIMHEIGSIIGVAANAFTNFEAAITGNSSIAGKTTTFHQFATAVGDAVHQLAELLNIMLDLEKIGVNLGSAVVTGVGSGVHKIFHPTQNTSSQDSVIRGQLSSSWDATKDLWSVVSGSKSYDGGSWGSPGNGGTAGTPADLIARMIHAESNGNPNAVSRSGAIGLMQLMPSTAAQLGVNPYDPKQNVSGGSALIGRLIHKYGNVDTALAAYNWGEGNLDMYRNTGHWLTRSGQTSYTVPQETRDYVKKITGDNLTLQVNVNVASLSNTSPEHVADAARRGSQQALNDYHRQMITETGGAYAQ